MTGAPRVTRPSGGPGRRGRRPGDSADRKDAILEAARTSFADHGYTRTTIRGVAAAAGVDPALVHHYFGSKDDLFLAALELPVDPRVVLAPALAGGLDGAGERFLRVFLSVWDDPALRPRLVAVARGMLDPGGSDLLRTGFLKTVLEPVGRTLGVDRPEHRMPLVASQVVGLILMRYLVEMEPIVSMPAEQVVATYAPTIQRYLADDLP